MGFVAWNMKRVFKKRERERGEGGGGGGGGGGGEEEEVLGTSNNESKVT